MYLIELTGSDTDVRSTSMDHFARSNPERARPCLLILLLFLLLTLCVRWLSLWPGENGPVHADAHGKEA